MNILKRSLAVAMLTGVALSGAGVAHAETLDLLKPKTDCVKRPNDPACVPPLAD